MDEKPCFVCNNFLFDDEKDLKSYTQCNWCNECYCYKNRCFLFTTMIYKGLNFGKFICFECEDRGEDKNKKF